MRPELPLDGAYLDTTLVHGERLCLLELCLEHFRDRDLDGAALSNVRAMLEFFALRGRQILFRGTYDLEGRAMEKEPVRLGQILAHMEQIAPLLLDFASHVLLVQGLFVGAWGEMHSSRYVDASSLQTLYRHWRTLTRGRLRLSLRTPALADLAGAEDVGLYDDALLADDGDMGTFPRGRDRCRPWWKPMVAAAPFGGEALLGMDLDARATEALLRDMELSYLNIQYDSRLLDRWRAMAYGQGSFFDHVERHMGYRFLLRRLAWRRGWGCAELEIELENTGWARCYEELYWELEREESSHAKEGGRALPGQKPEEDFDRAGQDVRASERLAVAAGAWLPGQKHVIKWKLPLTYWPEARLYLRRRADHAALAFANKAFSSTIRLPMGQP